MAIMTEEEKRRERKLRGLGASARNTLSGAADWAGNVINKTNDIVRNTSPVREMYGAANILKGLVTGDSEQSPVPKISEIPEPPKAAPEPIQQVPMMSNYQTSDNQTNNNQTVVSRPRALQPKSDANELPYSNSPNLSYSSLIDESGKNMGVREIYNGPTNSAPAMQTSFVSPKRFASRTGWDAEGNPIYNDGSAAMSAANAGIAANNLSSMQGYEQRNKEWLARNPQNALSPEDQKTADELNNRKLAIMESQAAADIARTGAARESKWSLKSMGDPTMGTVQDMLFNDDGRSIPLNEPPAKGAGVIDAVYKSPRGPMQYKGLDENGEPIYIPFKVR